MWPANRAREVINQTLQCSPLKQLEGIAGTICTPIRHSWQHDLDPAGEELEMSANRVWKWAAPMDRITWITKNQFYLYITVNPKSDKTIGLPLVRGDVRHADDVPSMMT